VGQLANLVRERLHGDVTYYNRNLHLNSTNVCEADCLFCSFARLREGMPEAYTMSVAKALRWISERYQKGMTEIHIVNGLNPDLTFDYYLELLREIRANYPELHIKAFTAVEIHYFAEKYGMSYEEVLRALVEAGLGSLPGGGAEIFAARVRKKICRDKVDADGWLEVHRVAHGLGLHSNCTMLYAPLRHSKSELITSSGFGACKKRRTASSVHSSRFPSGEQPSRPIGAPTGADDLRTVAVSRLMLHNIPHIKAYWIMLGIKTAQLAQRFGASDLDGTVTEEKIYHMAGSQSPGSLTVDGLRKLIQDIGRRPVERTTTYGIIPEQEEAQPAVSI